MVIAIWLLFGSKIRRVAIFRNTPVLCNSLVILIYVGQHDAGDTQGSDHAAQGQQRHTQGSQHVQGLHEVFIQTKKTHNSAQYERQALGALDDAENGAQNAQR